MDYEGWYDRSAAVLLGGNLAEAVISAIVMVLCGAFLLSAAASLGAVLFKGNM